MENNHLPQVSKRNVFPLLQLPRELRDGIYRHSITAGNLGILRISKTVNEEASQLLSKYAVLRVNAGFVDRTNWSDLGPGAEVSIQRVEFRLNESPDALPYDYDVIARFANRQVVRESCIVTINYGKDGSAPYHIERSLLFLSLGALTGFKSVVVRMVVERHEASEFEGLLTEEKFRDIFPYDLRLVDWFRTIRRATRMCGRSWNSVWDPRSSIAAWKVITSSSILLIPSRMTGALHLTSMIEGDVDRYLGVRFNMKLVGGEGILDLLKLGQHKMSKSTFCQSREFLSATVFWTPVHWPVSIYQAVYASIYFIECPMTILHQAYRLRV